MRIHLLSGDVARSSASSYGWFTKAECARLMEPGYYASIQDML